MQNHGGYDYIGNNFENSVIINGNNSRRVSQYLTLLQKTDDALEYLISYFRQVDEPTVILFFGDHQPRLEEDFYEQLAGKNPVARTLEQQERNYMVPFVIWANYPLEKKDVNVISANYLSQLLLETANLPETKWDHFRKNVRDEYPAINILGALNPEGTWVPLDQVKSNKIDDYVTLQYHKLFQK